MTNILGRHPTQHSGSDRTEAVHGVLRRLNEDVHRAMQTAYFCTLGTSILTPRLVRRALYLLAGAPVRSAPGTHMRFRGAPSNLTLGSGTSIGDGVFLDAVGPVVIGNGCGIAPQVMILTAHHAIDSEGRWSSTTIGRQVTIGDNVWIASRAVILPGTTIESNVVIAAGAVVSGLCRSGGLYAGVPARRIKEYGPTLPQAQADTSEAGEGDPYPH